MRLGEFSNGKNMFHCSLPSGPPCPSKACSNLDSTVSGLVCLFSCSLAVRDKSKFKDKKILIAGGGDSAIDWTNDLALIADVTLIHRRKEFRAAPDSVSKMLELENDKKINFKN